MSYEVWGEPDDDYVSLDKLIEAGWINPEDQSRALVDVMNERIRQQDAEGFTAAHDDMHVNGELASAAADYAAQAGRRSGQTETVYRDAHPPVHDGDGMPMWPFELRWWKPDAPRRDLVRAGALILAEIERLDRAAVRAKAVGRAP